MFKIIDDPKQIVKKDEKNVNYLDETLKYLAVLLVIVLIIAAFFG